MAPSSSNGTSETTDIVALVNWLQTFSSFTHRIVNGHDGEIALETVLDALGSQAVARSILKIADEVCSAPTDDNHAPSEKQSADEIWTSLLIMTSTRARPLVESPVTDRKQMSPTRLKIYVMSNLLDCAVQCQDLQRRRLYIEAIMSLPKPVQQLLMSFIEKRTRTPIMNRTPSRSSNGSGSKVSSNSGGAGSDSKRRPSSETKAEVRTPSQQSTPPRNASNNRLIAPNAYNTPPRSSRARPNSSPSGYTPASTRPRTANNDGSMLTPGTLDSPNAIQTIFSDLQSRNEKLQKVVETYKKRESDLQTNLDTIHGDYRKQMLQLEHGQRDELQGLEAEYEERIRTMTSDLQRYQNLAEQGERAMKELATARDEVDVLQHSAAALKETQEKLRRYKEKYAELQDIRDAYKNEQDRHALSIEECIRLSNELEQLKGLKRQLEEYKTRALQAECKLIECQDYLQQLETQTNQQSTTNEILLKGAAMQQEQLEEMRRRMEQEAAELEAHGPGVGEAINEFNSEVAGELKRLRNENVQLKAFASKRENDAVARLEQALDDAKGMAEQYKHEFLNANRNLTSTQVKLSESVARENMLQDEIQLVKQRLDEIEHSKRLVQERLDRCELRLATTTEQLQDAEKRLADTKDELEQWQQRTRKVEQESAEHLRKWQSAQRELSETLRELEGTGQMVLELQERLSYQEEQAELMERNEANLRQSIREKESTIADMQRQYDDKDKSLADACRRIEEIRGQLDRANDTVEKAKADNAKLSSQLENERQARYDAEEEAHTTLEETRKLLEQKHKREINEMIGNMNCQLDDERRESRRKDDDHNKRMKDLDENWRMQYEELEKRLTDAIKQTRQEMQQRVDQLKQEHEAELQKCQAEADASQQSIIDKGNSMLQAAQTQAEQANQLHQEQIQAVEQEKEELEAILRQKINSLKGNLIETTDQVISFKREHDNAQTQLRNIEREKQQLRDDNDRYKRQLGGHFGTDGSIQAQLEKLQLEYTAVVQENRNLKQRARDEGITGVAINPKSDSPDVYHRGKRNESFLQQMRRDYDEQIDSLNDEKRNLVMEKAAAAVNANRAEQLAWEKQQEVERLKRELYEVKIAIARNKRTDHSVDSSLGPTENYAPIEDASFLSDKNTSFHTAHSGNTPTQSKTPERPRLRTPNHSPSIEVALKHRESQEKKLRSRISMLTQSTPPPASPPPRMTPPHRANGYPARSISGQRYKVGVSLLDSELNAANNQQNKNVLSPTNKHVNQQRPSQPYPDPFGLGSSKVASASWQDSSRNKNVTNRNVSQQRSVYDYPDLLGLGSTGSSIAPASAHDNESNYSDMGRWDLDRDVKAAEKPKNCQI
ncbi:hypothetical protein MPSEU_000021200 [Mayamaea pseudoterrestris]|nr:hypothetical protein MPSEU_000021200 [Mayamaea pseudoterrestris]